MTPRELEQLEQATRALEAEGYDRNMAEQIAAGNYLRSISRCPGCGYVQPGARWGPDSVCRDCYERDLPPLQT